jgi:N-acyl homoserine lactone hydrolase
MKIHAVQTGVVHVKGDFLAGTAAAGSIPAFFYRLLKDRRWIDLPIYAWVIEHEEGVFVVDTGDLADTFSNFISQSTYTVQPEEELAAQLARLGFAKRDVAKIILTHLHGDHVNGLRRLDGVPVYLGPDEYAYYRSWFGGAFSRRTTRLPDGFAPLSLAKGGAFGPFDYSLPITRAGDVIAVPTPGHTGGHISVIALDGGTSWFLAGDVTYDQQGLLAQRVQGPSLYLTRHVDTLRRVLGYAQDTPTVYLPSHDAASGIRLAKRQTLQAQAVEAVGV